MRLLKRLGWILLGIIIFLLLVSFFLPATVRIERSKYIPASPSTVYGLLNNLKTYDDWMPWNRIDPQMQKTYGPLSEGQGASYSWSSANKKVGSGTLTITGSLPDKQVLTSLQFGDMPATIGGWNLTPQDTGTLVNWYMDAKMTGTNPFYSMMGKYMGLFMDKMVGPDFEQGLDSLSDLAQRTHTPRMGTYKLDTVQTTAQIILYLADKADSAQDISKKLAKIYGEELGGFIHKENLKMAGAPMAWYSSDQFPLTFEAGLPVDKVPGKATGRIQVRHTLAGPALVAHYFGPYELDGVAYKAIKDWMQAHGKTASAPPYEVYVGDPGVEKDPYKVQTDIIQPLK
jgi:effector-binding domain-containing protein